jgi:hypothetical protein
MDILFGTYVCPKHEPEQFGIHEQFQSTYIGQMLRPVLPDKIWEFIENIKIKEPPSASKSSIKESS